MKGEKYKMTEEQILIEIINLSLAIRNNNLDSAKIQINNINNYFNNSSNLNLNSGQLKELLGFANNYGNMIINETFYYALDNLPLNSEDVIEIKKTIEIIQLLNIYSKDKDKTKIQNYITKNLSHITSIFDYQNLIRLCHIIQDYDLLYLIKQSMEKGSST